MPFEAPTVEELVAAHVQIALTPPKQVVPDISQNTSDSLVRMMAKNPAERFLSYDELRMVLELCRSQLLIQKSQAKDIGGKSKTSWWRR